MELKMSLKTFGAVAATAVLMPTCAFAFDLPQESNVAVQAALDFVTMGKYGPQVIAVIDAIGRGAVILTALAFSVENLLTVCAKTLEKARLQNIADRIKAARDGVTPWIKYFSIYNVSKGKAVHGVATPAPESAGK
jgi:hypothetical protein